MGWNLFFFFRIWVRVEVLSTGALKIMSVFFLSPRSLALYFCIILFQAFVLSFWNFRISVFLSRCAQRSPISVLSPRYLDLGAQSQCWWQGDTKCEEKIGSLLFLYLVSQEAAAMSCKIFICCIIQGKSYGWQGLGSDPRARSQFGCVQFTLMYPVHFGVSLCATGARLTWFNVGTV